ncbi:MAG: hypothetical protein JWO09_3865 [Bacteroidetes bacterium]|nr:hypothetical protein [Bacteroidota bacterium]
MGEWQEYLLNGRKSGEDYYSNFAQCNLITRSSPIS